MNMRSTRIALLLLAAMLMAPFSAHAVSVVFCTPNCSTEGARTATFGPGVVTPAIDANGQLVGATTSLPLTTFILEPFTITATVTSQQSGTLQKITFSPTIVSANVGSGCTNSSACTLEIIATSDRCDFPLSKPIGGYPAGVYMMGSFSGTEVTGDGDTVSMTGKTSGLAP